MRSDTAHLEREIANLVEAVADGGGAALGKAIAAKEAELGSRRALLAQLEAADNADEFDFEQVRRDLAATLSRLHELLASPRAAAPATPRAHPPATAHRRAA